MKNYWNTHIIKKAQSHKEDTNANAKEIVNKPHLVIKPQPRTFSSTSPWLRRRILSEEQSGAKQSPTQQACVATSSNDKSKDDQWWETMMDNNKGGNSENDEFLLDIQDMLMKDFNGDEELIDCHDREGQFSWSDFLDINLWDS